MSRKQWMIAGVLIIVMLVVGVMVLRNNISGEPVDTVQYVPASTLMYCSEEELKPCVVSFSLDVDGNMLVNILLPELTYPLFRLKITRGETELDYRCQRVSTALTSAYCIGEKLPPGELLHLKMFSIRDEILLAEGDLSIIGLALPTLAVVSPTSEIAPTEPTAIPLTSIPTSTPTQSQVPVPTRSKPTPLPTSTEPSYPGPSNP